jgi:hypothetical protein
MKKIALYFATMIRQGLNNLSRGFARIFSAGDFFSMPFEQDQMTGRPQYTIKRSSPLDDVMMARRDWAMINRDYKKAIARYKSELKG